MTNKNIILLVVVLIIALLIGGAYFYNQQISSENSGDTAQDNMLEGEILFGIKDMAADMGSISSVVITVDKVDLHSQANGWFTITEETKEYDLLSLKQSGAISLLVQDNVEPGTYDQIRLTIGKVFVTKNGVQQEAKLPSKELKLIGDVVVNADQKSTVVIDFIADKSLHVTGNGKFIFSPVIKLETRSNADAKVNSNNEINIVGGNIDSDVSEGMDLSGEVKINFELEEDINIEMLNDEVLKITKKGENANKVKVSADDAVKAAINNGNIDSVTSVMLSGETGSKKWIVSGLKNFVIVNVQIDAETGAVLN